MEHVDCNLCGLDDTRVLFRKRDKFHISDDEFQVVACQRCGLLYVNPRPTETEIGKFYPETYSWKETFEADSFPIRWIRNLEKGYRYHLLKDEASKVLRVTGRKGGKVLDIGCGTGDRLDVLRERGFETYGVETSDSADYATDHLKLNVVKGDLFSAHFPGAFFDMVTLYNVLEHTHHPVGVIREINRILKKEGLLIIQVPNKDSLQCKIFKKRWAAFDVPRDLYYFGTHTLTSLLQKGGFQIKGIDQFMNWWHPPTLVISLFPTLDPQSSWAKEGRGGNPLFQRLAWIFCTLLLSPCTQFESATGRGALVTYYGIKEMERTV
jgi:2-polyprenyl-3-methyl-5-hydroxy-6-metoxy-1,4-benzoquinol methylase